MTRRAARTDANQVEIVAVLRKIGCSVDVNSGTGNGRPDLWVGYHGRTLGMEVKDGAKPPSKRQLTPDQVKFHANWRGDLILIVYSPDDAISKLLTAVGCK